MVIILVVNVQGDTCHIPVAEQLGTEIVVHNAYDCTENSILKLSELHSWKYKATPSLHHSKWSSWSGKALQIQENVMAKAPYQSYWIGWT